MIPRIVGGRVFDLEGPRKLNDLHPIRSINQGQSVLKQENVDLHGLLHGMGPLLVPDVFLPVGFPCGHRCV